MPSLLHGLNLSTKPRPSSNAPVPAQRRTIFDDNSDSEDGKDGEGTAKAINEFGGEPVVSVPSRFTPHNKASGSRPGSKRVHAVSQYGDLSTSHTSSKHAANAQELDPSVYDYDGVYDSLHAVSKKPAPPSGPKYIDSLQAAAEVRKRDQLRAKDKMLAKEREAEGKEFDDKEKFVTEAYKAQQQEVRRLEEEEREKEEREAGLKRRGVGGMTGLYKSLLDQEEVKHGATMKAVEEAMRHPDVKHDQPATQGKTEAELTMEAEAQVNDEGQVVDKRQLLKAGLNVTAKPKMDVAATRKPTGAKPSSSMAILQGRGGSKAAMRERQSQMLEGQLEEAAKRAADDEVTEKEALHRAAKSRKTQSEVAGARERYLQRKREAEAVRTVVE